VRVHERLVAVSDSQRSDRHVREKRDRDQDQLRTGEPAHARTSRHHAKTTRVPSNRERVVSRVGVDRCPDAKEPPANRRLVRRSGV
jgi:hypothetical protein